MIMSKSYLCFIKCYANILTALSCLLSMAMYLIIS